MKGMTSNKISTAWTAWYALKQLEHRLLVCSKLADFLTSYLISLTVEPRYGNSVPGGSTWTHQDPSGSGIPLITTKQDSHPLWPDQATGNPTWYPGDLEYTAVDSDLLITITVWQCRNGPQSALPPVLLVLHLVLNCLLYSAIHKVHARQDRLLQSMARGFRDDSVWRK